MSIKLIKKTHDKVSKRVSLLRLPLSVSDWRENLPVQYPIH